MASNMSLENPLSPALCAAAAGVLLHLGVFIRGEWEKYVAQLALLQVTGPLVVLGSLVAFLGQPLSQAAATAALLTASFNVGLYGSISVYRLFFHPLRRFYGPTGGKLTSLWAMKETFPDLKFYVKLQKLHQDHGDFIRFQPRALSINNAEAIQDIYGSTSKCTKGPFYDLDYPGRSLHMTRDRKFHSQRRKQWDRAFTSRALSNYEKRLKEHFKYLDLRISENMGKPINATDLCEYWGFDVMGDLMFGRPFNQLKENKAHFALEMARKAKFIGGLTLYPYWIFMLLQRLPIVSSLRLKWLRWCRSQMEQRRQSKPEVLDLYSYLLEDSSAEKAGDANNSATADLDALFDAELAIVAGSDTSSATLAASLYLLAKHPHVQSKLRQEVDDAVAAAGGELSYQTLVNRPLLGGVINEALRLYPPVVPGLQRLTPPEGATIAGRFVPGDTLVSVQCWSVQRDPRNFPQPEDFIPERWSSMPELALHKEALIAFSTGTYSCVGRPLAMMELKLAVAMVARRFEVAFADPAESVRLFEESPGWQDSFTARVPPVKVCFREREKRDLA
ncbi:high nitrogen upregulated cytochrome p450 monooxygenase 1 [Diplodia corticola]|uniref:High nitrogen upregulated cytochrome p450 monooxygenase 1 n=1 Tax=Diplodia corticola TaxID=236234 RepID=A0A1J9RW95_9PEZI|nr:high nitrogen upregulated cytochrome p450 monooxygenase 1 [Diplodia corticola]OJD31749.1 high nitrogen upregulated cytochrome p450 monooxygenase 1 [Diplodia corticola]